MEGRNVLPNIFRMMPSANEMLLPYDLVKSFWAAKSLPMADNHSSLVIVSLRQKDYLGFGISSIAFAKEDTTRSHGNPSRPKWPYRAVC